MTDPDVSVAGTELRIGDLRRDFGRAVDDVVVTDDAIVVLFERDLGTSVDGAIGLAGYDYDGTELWSGPGYPKSDSSPVKEVYVAAADSSVLVDPGTVVVASLENKYELDPATGDLEYVTNYR